MAKSYCNGLLGYSIANERRTDGKMEYILRFNYSDQLLFNMGNNTKRASKRAKKALKNKHRVNQQPPNILLKPKKTVVKFEELRANIPNTLSSDELEYSIIFEIIMRRIMFIILALALRAFILAHILQTEGQKKQINFLNRRTWIPNDT